MLAPATTATAPPAVEALWCEGFERLHSALAAAKGDDPLSRLGGPAHIAMRRDQTP